MNPRSTRNIRCAIYTRKSSEEGLEQDFNSLDAQREACAAYVMSQASEGWMLLPQMYDDGGISGGTLERPALQRLLEDVRSGRIDIIVVYKVDRLTRSLLDFAKLVEAFDAAGVSFVSVTQSFNTTTSMGRLTLNMLLSFAQFEREVTAERIRDKIAQSKARGMWMGGTPPLGYKPDGKNSLTIVEDHAAVIRDIFQRYRRLGNVRLVSEELKSEAIRTPERKRKNGSIFGGSRFTRGQLYHILRNPTYAGKIAHKGKVYAGKHKDIIDQAVWEAVQQQLSENVRGVKKAREDSKALLAGKLFDDKGEMLIPVHSSKPGGSAGSRRRYCYYVSRSTHHHTSDPVASLRIPASEIENTAINELAKALADPIAVIARLSPKLPPHQFEAAKAGLEKLRQSIAAGKRKPARSLLERAIIHADRLELCLDTGTLADAIGIETAAHGTEQLVHIAQLRLTRSGHCLNLIDTSGVSAGTSTPDPTLTGLIVQARRWWRELAKGELDITTLSRREGVTASWMTRVVRLAFLSPPIVDALLAGQQPAVIEGRSLLAPGAVARDWDKQKAQILG